MREAVWTCAKNGVESAASRKLNTVENTSPSNR